MGPLVAVLPYITAAVTVVSAIGQGEATNNRAKAAAERLRLEAIQEAAVGQAKGAEVHRQTRLVSSRAQSLLAASGADSSGPGAERIFGDIAAEGEYRARLAMYEGDSRGATLKGAAQDQILQGSQARTAGYISALGAADSIYKRYKTPAPLDS